MVVVPGEGDLLVVIDVQNDFCPGGALAVPEGEAVVPVINRITPLFPHVIATQDWHPRGHGSFASSHPGKKPYETMILSYGPQVLWPDHCVQESPGAAFHSGLRLANCELVLRKGFNPAIDSYSAFFENDRATPTGCEGYCRQRGFTRLFLAGLATDFCVFYSALDARRLGFEVYVVEEACRGIDLDGSVAKAWVEMKKAGVHRIASAGIGR